MAYIKRRQHVENSGLEFSFFGLDLGSSSIMYFAKSPSRL